MRQTMQVGVKIILWLAFIVGCILPASALAGTPENCICESFSIGYDAAATEATTIANDCAAAPTLLYNPASAHGGACEEKPTEMVCALFGQSPEFKAAEDEAQQLFRVVNDKELNGIQQLGKFEFPSLSGSAPTGQPGKFFWGKQNEAEQFQRMWYRGGESSHIVTTTIGPDVNPMLFSHGDGIGTSMFVNLEDLTAPIKLLPKP